MDKLDNWPKTNRAILFICISSIHSNGQNLLKAQSMTVVQSCFKQTVITNCFQPQSEVLLAYMLYFLMSYTACLFLILRLIG